MVDSDDPGDAANRAITVERLTFSVPSDGIGVHRIATFVHILKHVVAPQQRTLVDLGAGHCKFSVWATKLGFEVTAVDGRTAEPPRISAPFGSWKLMYAPMTHAVMASWQFSACCITWN